MPSCSAWRSPPPDSPRRCRRTSRTASPAPERCRSGRPQSAMWRRTAGPSTPAPPKSGRPPRRRRSKPSAGPGSRGARCPGAGESESLLRSCSSSLWRFPPATRRSGRAPACRRPRICRQRTRRTTPFCATSRCCPAETTGPARETPSSPTRAPPFARRTGCESPPEDTPGWGPRRSVGARPGGAGFSGREVVETAAACRRDRPLRRPIPGHRKDLREVAHAAHRPEGRPREEAARSAVVDGRPGGRSPHRREGDRSGGERAGGAPESPGVDDPGHEADPEARAVGATSADAAGDARAPDDGEGGPPGRLPPPRRPPPGAAEGVPRRLGLRYDRPVDRAARERIADYVKPLALGLDGGTHFGDVRRAIAAALRIGRGREGLDADLLFLLAAFSGQEKWVSRMGHRSRTELFLAAEGVPRRTIAALFRSLGRFDTDPRTPEEEIVHDAVRLDRLGAYGVARLLAEGYRERLDLLEMAAEIDEAVRTELRTPQGQGMANDRRATMQEFAARLRAEYREFDESAIG